MKQGFEPKIDPSSAVLPNVQELVEINALLKQENQQLKAKYEALLEQFRLFQHRRFGASSEKFPVEQRDLFNEAEAECGETAEDEAVPLTEEPEEAPAGKPTPKATRGRKALPKELPRDRDRS